MIRIAICDDDVKIVEEIQSYLENKNKQTPDEDFDISIYQSGEDFLLEVDSGAAFHIVFMDIQMKGISGVSVGQILRNKPNGDDIILIYVSSHDEYFEGLVEIGSFRFIGKPIDERKLDDVFKRALNLAIKHKSAYTPKLFEYKIGADKCVIDINKIAYMKHIVRLIEIHAQDGCISKFYGKLNEAIEQLPAEQFVRCERSHIVNLSYVARIESDKFVLKDKAATKIPISNTYKQDVRLAYFKYLESLS
jgi:Response regulator of the LytR/AlgR family